MQQNATTQKRDPQTDSSTTKGTTVKSTRSRYTTKTCEQNERSWEAYYAVSAPDDTATSLCTGAGTTSVSVSTVVTTWTDISTGAVDDRPRKSFKKARLARPWTSPAQRRSPPCSPLPWPSRPPPRRHRHPRPPRHRHRRPDEHAFHFLAAATAFRGELLGRAPGGLAALGARGGGGGLGLGVVARAFPARRAFLFPFLVLFVFVLGEAEAFVDCARRGRVSGVGGRWGEKEKEGRTALRFDGLEDFDHVVALARASEAEVASYGAEGLRFELIPGEQGRVWV
ncbi:hypothetical protein OF83DRAFT_624537 [Amylostereum chailletii]|nr:hypothetical protein OF83DRAFT_624537 [Amylostereum chailletii]